MRWLVAIAMILAACSSGDDERTLTLPSGTKTEAEWRAIFRSVLLESPTEDAAEYCRRISALSDREVIETFLASADLPVSQLDRVPSDDIDRAGELFKDECRRVT